MPRLARRTCPVLDPNGAGSSNASQLQLVARKLGVGYSGRISNRLTSRPAAPQIEIVEQAKGLRTVLPGDEELLGLCRTSKQRWVHRDGGREQREKECNQPRRLRRPAQPAAHPAHDYGGDAGCGESDPER